MKEKIRYRILIILFFSCVTSLLLVAQKENSGLTSVRVSCAEKRWALFHPFIAKKSYRLTKTVLYIADSIKGTNRLDGDINGGQLDAFKHAYWMACLSQHVKGRKALKLGKAHERGNYKFFKKSKKKGSQTSHDKAGSDMDLWNNQQGIEIGQKLKGNNLMIIQQTIIDSIEAGKMKIILKNPKGQYLDFDGKVIPVENLSGKWENKKCLVPSNYSLNEN